MAKEACERFDVRAKQLSRVLTGRKYLGGTQARKHKATEEPAKRRKTWLNDMTRHTTTQHNTNYVISSVHTAKNNHKSITAHHLVHHHQFLYRWHKAGFFK